MNNNNNNNLNKRRLYYANKRGTSGEGYFNCWGATLFVLGYESRLKWVDCYYMERFLEKNTLAIHRPGQVGDILRIDSWFSISHTAVYLGNGKYFHKRGQNTSEITTLAGIRKTYRLGRYSWARLKGQQ